MEKYTFISIVVTQIGILIGIAMLRGYRVQISASPTNFELKLEPAKGGLKCSYNPCDETSKSNV